MGSTAACGDDDKDDKSSAGDPASQTESESPTETESTESESSDPTESTDTESADPDRSEFCTAAVAQASTRRLHRDQGLGRGSERGRAAV